jgi:hypothetical protein
MLGAPKTDGLRIEEVAWRCGFSSAAHFSRLFKQRYGATPKELRDGGKSATPDASSPDSALEIWLPRPDGAKDKELARTGQLS